MAGDPRIRGEHEDKRYADWDRAGSSPHTRGARRNQNRRRLARQIIPAYAGSTAAPPLRRARNPDHPRIRGEHTHKAAIEATRPDHPRIRGEHEVFAAHCASYVGSSPHTRGAPPERQSDPIMARIIPAYAGSTRRRLGRGPASPDHPRIRGEHDSAMVSGVARRGSSPHTRGALRAGIVAPHAGRIIPAYAGSTPTTPRSGRPQTDHPRIRGEHSWRRRRRGPGWGSSPHTRGARLYEDGPDRVGLDHPRIRGEHYLRRHKGEKHAGSSPHTRGARRAARSDGGRGGIIPAYAGSTAGSAAGRPARRDHPRIRGEHPVDHVLVGIVERIIPAYAGSTFFVHPAAVMGWDHPRIRGEHDLVGFGGELGDGSSPHTRGARLRRQSDAGSHRDHPRIRGEHWVGFRGAALGGGSSPHTRGAPSAGPEATCRMRIIPAYAGSTRSGCGTRFSGWDHPRIRGEHMSIGFRPDPDGGSSPHTRGARRRRRGCRRGSRIIPAYAGSTISWSSHPPEAADHPRIRGEHDSLSMEKFRARGSSPHTRGARCRAANPGPDPGIIPAYAGSTVLALIFTRAAEDHPRIRGEHPDGRRKSPPAPGSSPHTRGARRSWGVGFPPGRIIPAYAGSTWVAWVVSCPLTDHPRIRGEH